MRLTSRWKKWLMLLIGGGSVTLFQASCLEPAILIATVTNAVASLFLIRAVLE